MDFILIKNVKFAKRNIFNNQYQKDMILKFRIQ